MEKEPEEKFNWLYFSAELLSEMAKEIKKRL